MCLDIHFQNIKKWNKIEIIVKNEQLGLLGSFFLLNVTLERRLRNKIRSRECWPTEGELSRLFDLSLSFSLRLCIFLLYFNDSEFAVNWVAGLWVAAECTERRGEETGGRVLTVTFGLLTNALSMIESRCSLTRKDTTICVQKIASFFVF